MILLNSLVHFMYESDINIILRDMFIKKFDL